MKPTLSLRAIRPGALTPPSPAMPRLTRCYASSNGLGTTAAPTQKRRSVTPFNDTGSVPWSELSSAEKAARATQQSFNFGLIMAGLVLTVCHGQLLAFCLCSPADVQDYLGRRRLPPLDRSFFPRRQDIPVQPRRQQDQEGFEMHRTARRPQAHHGPRRRKLQQVAESSSHCVRPTVPHAFLGHLLITAGSSSERTDPQGNAHLVMRFHVSAAAHKRPRQRALMMPRSTARCKTASRSCTW